MTTKKRNPVHFMDSADALDLIAECLRLLRLDKPASLEFLDRLREQILRHKRALRNIIGTEKI